MLSIGQISQKAGVKVPTIRYYEQMRLIQPAARSSGNQRRYTQTELECLSFIRHARELGLPIETIRELLEMAQTPDMPCQQAHAIALTHLRAIKSRIRKLRRLEKELSRMTETCHSGTIGECDVIRSLADHSLCESAH